MKHTNPRSYSNYSIDAIMSPYTIPLTQSNHATLPFPIGAATRLGSERSKRYDDLLFTMDEAEEQLRLLASIMGMLPTNDDAPAAA